MISFSPFRPHCHHLIWITTDWIYPKTYLLYLTMTSYIPGQSVIVIYHYSIYMCVYSEISKQLYYIP